MYRILAIDGREYGPVTADQLKEWIAAGRANASTRTQLEGAAEWKPLSEFPEFAEMLTAKSPPPAEAVPASSGNATSLALETKVVERDYYIDVGACLGRAWDKLMTDLWPAIGVTALIWLIFTGTHAFYIGVMVTGPLLGGLYYYYLRKIRGQPAALPDAFAGFTGPFLQLMLASLVSGLLIAVGLALCLIPGIYLAVAWSFALPLIIDRQMGFWEAMELSRTTVYKHWWSIAWLLLVCGLINIGGALLCCIGVFFTLPLTGLAVVYAYEDAFASHAAKSA